MPTRAVAAHCRSVASVRRGCSPFSVSPEVPLLNPSGSLQLINALKACAEALRRPSRRLRESHSVATAQHQLRSPAHLLETLAGLFRFTSWSFPPSFRPFPGRLSSAARLYADCRPLSRRSPSIMPRSTAARQPGMLSLHPLCLLFVLALCLTQARAQETTYTDDQ